MVIWKAHMLMLGLMHTQAVAGGPRATDRFAAVTAAFVSGLAGTAKASEVVAFFLEAAASRMEAAMKVGMCLGPILMLGRGCGGPQLQARTRKLQSMSCSSHTCGRQLDRLAPIAKLP